MRTPVFILCLLAAAARADVGDLTAEQPLFSQGESREEREDAAFSGLLRFRARAARPLSASVLNAPPELRHGPYVSQLGRFQWGERARLGWLAKRPSPGPAFTQEALRRKSVVKYAVALPGRLLVGNYSLSYGQGLVFYDALGEFVRPVIVRGRGPEMDLSSGADDYLKGGVLRRGFGSFQATAFFSRMALNLPISPDGTADGDLWNLRAAVGDPLDEQSLGALNNVREEAAGARLEWGGIGATVARFRYGPSLRPLDDAFSRARAFQGRRNDVAGLDGKFAWDGYTLALEAARSRDRRRSGSAWTGVLLRAEGGLRFWTGVFSYDGDYFSRHGKGVSFDVEDVPGSLPANQRGMLIGARREGDWGRVEGDGAWAVFPAALGDGLNEDPVLSSHGRRWRVEGAVKPQGDVELLARVQERVRERWRAPPGAAGRAQGTETTRRLRLQSSWRASPRLRALARQDFRWERAPFVGRRVEGRSILGELKWRPGRDWSLSGRACFFQSPEAFLTAGLEEIWDGVVHYGLAGGMGNLRGPPGERYALIAKKRWGKALETWIKYDTNRRWKGAAAADSRHAVHFQADCRM